MNTIKSWIVNPDKNEGGLILNPEFEKVIREKKSTHPCLKDMSNDEFEDNLESLMVHMELYYSDLPDEVSFEQLDDVISYHFGEGQYPF